MTPIHVHEWQGGYKASCPSIPGCVVRHRDRDLAIYLVTKVAEAWHRERPNPRTLPN